MKQSELLLETKSGVIKIVFSESERGRVIDDFRDKLGKETEWNLTNFQGVNAYRGNKPIKIIALNEVTEIKAANFF